MCPQRKITGWVLGAFGLGILIGTAITSTFFGVLLGLILLGCGCGCMAKRR